MSDLAKVIITKMIEESDVENIRHNLRARTWWNITSNVCETTGHLLIGISAGVAFAAGVWNLQYLSYIAGATNLASMSLIKFSSYAVAESKERTQETNTILTSMKLGSIPDITFDKPSDNPQDI